MHTPSVNRTIRILDILSESIEPITLSDLSRGVGAPKSSLLNICNTLLEANLITRGLDKKLTLGAHSVRWANAFLSRIDITREFFGCWDKMQVLPEETITLSIRDRREVVYIACRNGSRPLGYSFKTGMRIPAIYTATGLAMLSTLPDGKISRLFDLHKDNWPKPLTLKGISNINRLLDELKNVRDRGYSVDYEGVCDGMYCFGAPVFDSHGSEAVAGVAVSILANTVDAELEKKAGVAMRALAWELTKRLGGNGPNGSSWHRMLGKLE